MRIYTKPSRVQSERRHQHSEWHIQLTAETFKPAIIALSSHLNDQGGKFVRMTGVPITYRHDQAFAQELRRGGKRDTSGIIALIIPQQGDLCQRFPEPCVHLYVVRWRTIL